jgi:hypothetical protein
MKIQPPSDRDRTQLAECLEHCFIGMLTQADANGALRARPMTALELDRDGNIWFLVERDSLSQRDLWRINVSFADAKCSLYISVCGSGELSEDSDRAQHLRSPLGAALVTGGSRVRVAGAIEGGADACRDLGLAAAPGRAQPGAGRLGDHQAPAWLGDTSDREYPRHQRALRERRIMSAESPNPGPPPLAPPPPQPPPADPIPSPIQGV